MERQIKFRGKRADNGEWVYGDLLRVGGGYIIYFGSMTETETPDIPNSSPVAVELFNDEIAVVIPETLGQFTGLTDCNGRDIYEGDILDTKTSDYVPNGYSFICKWIDSGFALIYQGRTYGVKERNNWMNKYPLCQKNVEDLVIMGNIHDNPEQLK